MSVADTIQSLGLLGPGSVVDLGRNPDSAKYPTVVPSDMLPQGAQRIVIPQTGTGTGTGTGPGGFSPTGMLPSGMSAAEFSAALDRMQGSGQFDDGDPDSHSEPLDPVSSTGFNFADAIFTGLGLLNPAFRAISLPFTLARGYDALFGEDDDVDTTALDAWGIDPLGTLGGIGGPPGLDDTTEDPPAPPAPTVDPTEFSGITGTPPSPPSPPGGGDEGAGDGTGDDAADAAGDSPAGSPWHQGGLLPGSGPKDIKAEGGEYVIRKSAVDKYGTDLFDMLNKGLLSV